MREPNSTVLEEGQIDRRTLFARAGVGGAGLLMGGFLGGCGGSDHHNNSSSSGTVSDVDVLNFALNLEYLEASYYTTGVGQFQLGTGDTSGSGTEGAVSGGNTVLFSSLSPYFQEIAFDESNHVRAVRAAIVARGGTPIARPAIDLNAVNVAIQTATSNPSFNAFANDTSFLLGAFLLSDVGATAYVGGAQYLSAAAVKQAAAQILAVEGYHVGSIRTLINQAGGSVAANSQLISDARDALDGSTDDDQGAGVGNDPNNPAFANIAPTDANGLAFPRTFSQVLAIVYNSSAAGTASGGLFPSGANGNIRAVGALP